MLWSLIKVLPWSDHDDIRLRRLLVANLHDRLVQHVHQPPTKLRIHVQVGQMRLGLLLGHHLGQLVFFF
jgi:hypothetical protein